MYDNMKDGEGINSVWWYVKELTIGQVANMRSQIGEYELAKKYNPDTVAFTENDVMHCADINDLPDDWRALAVAVIEKYGIK